MSIFDEPKIDCHNHVLDPQRFPYATDAVYRPAAQEIGTAAQLDAVLAAYGVRHALIVGPNSGYGTDNRCLLDVLEKSDGRHRGVAVVPQDIDTAQLRRLKARGIVGVTMNASYYETGHYANAGAMLDKLAALDMFIQVQVEHDQLVGLTPMLLRSGARIVIDHCGRPTPDAGIEQAGFQAVLELGRTGRASVKLSGYAKFSRLPYPYADTHRYIRALVDAYTLDACAWGSDWPYLRATERVDYGPLLKLVEVLFPDRASRQKLLWDTPRALFGFAA